MSSSPPAEIGTWGIRLRWCICQCQDFPLWGGSALTFFISGPSSLILAGHVGSQCQPPACQCLSILQLTWRGWVRGQVQCLTFHLCKHSLGSSLRRKVTGKTNVWVASEKLQLYDHGSLQGTMRVRHKYHLCSLWTGKPGVFHSSLAEGVILLPAFLEGTHLENTWHTVKQAWHT